MSRWGSGDDARGHDGEEAPDDPDPPALASPSYAVALTRDSERLLEVQKRINVLPLGR